MTYISDDSILLFEYFTASGEKDKCIISEAEALIFSLLDDLKDYNVTIVLNKSYKNVVKDYNNVTPIFIEEDIIHWLEKNAANFRRAIFIAAENNNNLYNITKILEENKVKIYNSSSDACLSSSDKFISYEMLYKIIPQPKSFKLKIDSVGYWKRALENLYKKWHAENPLDDLKLIIKPLVGVDCEDIKIINNINDLNYDLEEIYPPDSRILVQEFIDGVDISVSLLCDGETAIPISLNRQFINLNNDNGTYLGGQIPFETEFKDLAFKTAIKAVESIEGLKGFVGVDLLISNEKDVNDVYVLEINSRFTTPYVGLKKIANINIGSSIIDLIDGNISIGDLKEKISLEGNVEFKKSRDNLVIRSI
ncbi:ATP-grasp domain-containing protein [uncultured Methanobrevibacter sp.]|uniref:ATP-grasp domain-containing protein n=1 Tax=uncultured Methanobrevibacter sp. TaxID=253161 RepID=UPI0026017868|nr:ATP-grasp domain-containing protein [uncultured Methanobrevibacter sp.]